MTDGVIESVFQEKPDQFENEYETPEFRRDPLPESDNRLSGCSTSSEESECGASAMSVPQSLHSCKEPTESSWPSSPASTDDSEPECPERNPPSSKTLEPEAGLCLVEPGVEQIYENTSVIQMTTRTTPQRSASVRIGAKPHVPSRKLSVPSLTARFVPPKLPEKNPAMKIETQCK